MRSRLLRLAGGGAVVITGILTILGSGGGESVAPIQPAGDAPTIIKAFNFDANNSVTAARSAAAVMSFFPGFTALDRRALTTLSVADPANSPFDLAVCANAGHSLLTWIDADHSGDLSTGDSASLQLDGCDLDGNGATTTGTVKFGLTSITNGKPPYSISHNVALNLSVSRGAGTMAFSAAFGAMSTTTDGIIFTNTYTGRDTAAQTLAISRDGNSLYQFGCFTVIQTFSLADGAGTYELSPSGVIAAANSIMSLADGGHLSFINGAIEAGSERLLSASVPNCAALGLPDGVDGSDGSYLDLEALGGDNLRLHTYDSTHSEFFATETTWSALLN